MRKDGTLFWANVVITALRDAQRRARRLRQGHARPDRAPRGAAAPGGLRAPRARGSRAAAPPQRSARAVESRDRRPARPGRDPADRDRRGDRPDRRGLSACSSRSFTATGIIRSDDVDGDPTLDRGRCSGCPRPVRSYLALPISMADGEVAGGLIFGHPDAGVFDAEAEAAASSIASTAAVAIANARLLQSARREAAAREAALRQRDQVAVALQQSLLPPDLPAIPGLELGAHYHAGTELVGGDFYDVFALGEDTLGHRPGRRVRKRARGRVADRADPAHRPHGGDVRHRSRRPSCTPSTARCCARTRRASPRPTFLRLHGCRRSRRRRRSASPRRAIRRRSSSASRRQRRGDLRDRPAARRDASSPIEALQVADYRLRPGDTLVLYTDGLTEARTRGRALRRRRGQGDADACAGEAPPEQLANALVDAALEHAGVPLSDDVAIVILRVL